MKRIVAASAYLAFLTACSGGGSGTAPPIIPQSVQVGSDATSTLSVGKQGPPGQSIRLLSQFRPIGGSGDSVPNSPELAIVTPQTALESGPDYPNARTISNVVSGGGNSPSGTDPGQVTDPRLSAWLYVFGQFLDHDLGLEETPLTNADCSVIVPAGDPVFTPGTIIQMERDTRSSSTNTIINTTAGFLDLSQLYGSDTATAASLQNADGTLKSSTDTANPSDTEQYLPIVGGNFVTGDPRVMENPELTALTTLFLREHNYWVGTLKAQNPSWTPAQLYGMAKAITTAEYQNIVYTEYLPHLLGPDGVRPSGHFGGSAQETQEFSVSAFRMGHSQVSDTQDGISNTGATTFTQPLAEAFFNTPAQDISNGVDNILRSLGTDFSQATDPFAVAALRNLLFAGLVGGGIDEMDLIAIDIQRERDAGLGTLNQTRQALHLRPYTSFAELSPIPAVQALYQSTYGSINNVDLFMGGLAEAHAPGANVGPTFQSIIGDQFFRLRFNDRYFWTNQGFDPHTAQMISSTTLATILKRGTNTTGNFNADVFVQSVFPAPHVKQHVPYPHQVTAHGRNRAFMDDGE